MIRNAAVLSICGLMIFFLWWPAEIYRELRWIGPALLFLFTLFALSVRPAADSPEPSSPSPRVVVLFAALFLCLAVSTLSGVDAYRSAETLLWYSSAVSFAAGLALIRPETLVRQIETAFISLTVVLCLYGLYQYVYALPRLVVQPGLWVDVSNEHLLPVLTRMSGGRIFSRYALPSTFSCVLLAAIVLVHRRIREPGPIWIYASTLALLTVNLVLARSYAAVLLFCVYGWVDAWIRHPAVRMKLLIPALGLIGLVILYLRPASILNFSDPENPVRLRLANWSVAYSEFLTAPFSGVGPGNFALLFPAHTRGLTETRYAHGFQMTVLAETGLLGLMAWLGLAVCFLAWLIRASPKFAPSLLIIFAYALVDIVFELPSLGFLFFLLLGLSAAPSPVRLNYFRPALAVLSIAGALFSLVLFAAGGYSEKGMELIRGLRISKAALDRADEYFLKAKRLWPKAEVAAGLGQVELARYRGSPETGRPHLNAAAGHFAEAVRKSPATVFYRVALAETLLSLGDVPQATLHLKEAAWLDPRGPHVAKYLEILLGQSFNRTL